MLSFFNWLRHTNCVCLCVRVCKFEVYTLHRLYIWHRSLRVFAYFFLLCHYIIFFFLLYSLFCFAFLFLRKGNTCYFNSLMCKRSAHAHTHTAVHTCNSVTVDVISLKAKKIKKNYDSMRHVLNNVMMDSHTVHWRERRSGAKRRKKQFVNVERRQWTVSKWKNCRREK